MVQDVLSVRPTARKAGNDVVLQSVPVCSAEEVGKLPRWVYLSLMVAAAGATLGVAAWAVMRTQPDIVLRQVPDGRVFQRNADGRCRVPLSGRYTGKPGAIEVKVTGTDGTVVDWTTLDDAPTGGVFSGQVAVPTGGPYVAHVRCYRRPRSSDSGRTSWYVGALFVFIGQSNADALFYGGAPASPSRPSRQTTDCISWTPGATAGTAEFLDTFHAVTGVPCGALGAARGGTSLTVEAAQALGLDSWLDESPTGAYEQFLRKAAVLGNEFEGVVWIQGEADAHAASDGLYEDYYAGLNLIWSRIKSKLSFPVGSRFVVMATGRTTDDTNGTDSSWSDVRRAQRAWCGATPDAVYAGHAIPFELQDAVHWGPQGRSAAGIRLAQVAGQESVPKEYSGGPQIVGWKQHGSTVDVDIQHKGGTTILPPAGITGFSALDDQGRPIRVTSAVRKDNRTIRLAVRSSKRVKTLRYLYGRNPDIGGYVYDDTDTVSPLEPYDSDHAGWAGAKW